MPLFVKEVKPTRMKLEDMQRELLAAAKEFADGVLEDYNKTVETFRDKPEFTETAELMSDGIIIEVGLSKNKTPANINYARLDTGARPHQIVGRRGRLRFRTGYISKTLPKRLTSRPGGSFGPWRSSSAVNHPGFKGRDFEGAIAKKHTPRFRKIMEQAMKRAAKASGHQL